MSIKFIVPEPIEPGAKKEELDLMVHLREKNLKILVKKLKSAPPAPRFPRRKDGARNKQ